MKLHILSDLHLESGDYAPAVRDADVTLLAGDIGVGLQGITWARETFPGRVLYVAGNHEYYGGHLETTLEELRAASCERVRFLERDAVEIEGVRFLGATGWTDYTATGNEPLARLQAEEGMTDFYRIRCAPGNSRPYAEDFVRLNHMTRQWLDARLAEPFDGPTVVITHHAPSLAVSREQPGGLWGSGGGGSHIQAAYFNRWGDLLKSPVRLWVHGHTHEALARRFGDTRVVCNPRGYPGERTGFDANKVVEV